MEQYTELDEMRNQLAALKEKIATQEIINDRLLSKAVTRKMADIHRHRNFIIILGVIAIIIINIAFCYLQNYISLSSYFIAYSNLTVVFSIFMTYRYHYQMETSSGFNDNLLNTAKALKGLKKHYNQSYYYSIPMIIIFIGWFIYEFFQTFDFNIESFKFIISPMAVSATIGIICGISFNRKLTRMCDDIIEDIEGE